jgi:PBP1b-binding outer membrane lipoprotein LpoB
MRTFKRVILLIVIALLATGCSTLPPAPSYVPSPFAGMHGQ